MTERHDNLQEDMWHIKAAKKQSDEVRVCVCGWQRLVVVEAGVRNLQQWKDGRLAGSRGAGKIHTTCAHPHLRLHITPYGIQGWQQERERAASLNKELLFYKSASTTALAERDRASYDAQHSKAELKITTAALQECQQHLSLSQQLCRDLQQQVGDLQQQLETEQAEAAACRLQLKQHKQQHERQLQQERHELGVLQVGVCGCNVFQCVWQCFGARVAVRTSACMV